MTPPGPHAMTAQAGAVAVLHRNDAGQIYWTTSVPLPELPLGVYVPVEALEGLVAKWRTRLDDVIDLVPNVAAELLNDCADELTQLIKERSNG